MDHWIVLSNYHSLNSITINWIIPVCPPVEKKNIIHSHANGVLTELQIINQQLNQHDNCRPANHPPQHPCPTLFLRKPPTHPTPTCHYCCWCKQGGRSSQPLPLPRTSNLVPAIVHDVHLFALNEVLIAYKLFLYRPTTVEMHYGLCFAASPIG